MPTLDEVIAAIQEHGSQRQAARALGVGASTIRRWLAKGRTPTEPPPVPDHGFVPTDQHLPATHIGDEGVDTEDLSTPGRVRRFIVTSAQNNVDVHAPFLRNLETLAHHLDARLLISFTLYDRQGYRGLVRKGDASVSKNAVWWDKAVEPYAINKRAYLHRRLAFCGELDILATAKRPLSGLESYCGRSSVIVPHNRFAMQCVESRPHQMPKEMYTTGSVTRSRFIQRKAGQVAHFHHVLGALLVEVRDDNYWHVHHLNAEDDGSFYWLDRRVEDGRVSTGHRPDGLILGDIHHEKIDPAQNEAVQAIMQRLRPKHAVVHDLIDFTSRNHHNRDDALFRVKAGARQVATEIGEAGQWLHRLCTHNGAATVLVARGNHDEALERWIKETDWRDDPVNAAFYLNVARFMVGQAKAGSRLRDINALRWVIQDHFGFATDAHFLRADESYEVAGIEVGVHGHIGPSGARGTPRNFAKLGFKTFTAHTHTPSIVDGCYTVGVTGLLDMGYNRGPSKWMHCHGLIYPNGKRAFLFVKKGRWRA